jgi:hypothetical protein
MIRTFHHRLAREVTGDPDLMEAVKERVHEEITWWCERNGYTYTRVSLSMENEDGPFSTYVLVASATCRPIWDGVWGDLRAALADDGLLPARDRDDPSSPYRGSSGAMFSHGAHPPKDPCVGDVWMQDPFAGDLCTAPMVRIWDGKRWTVGLDPARS